MLTLEGEKWLCACVTKQVRAEARLRVTCEAGTYERPAQIKVSRVRSERHKIEVDGVEFDASFPTCVVQSPRSLELLNDEGQVLARHFAPATRESTDGIECVGLGITIRVGDVAEPHEWFVVWCVDLALGEASVAQGRRNNGGEAS